MKRSMFLAMGLCAASGLFAPVALADTGMSPEAKFKQMDNNGDGKVSRDEFTKFANDNYQKMDTNHDGSLTITELSYREGAPKGVSSADKLKKMDSNGDGKISADEYKSAKQARFDEIDVNHDGSLSETEFTESLKQK